MSPILLITQYIGELIDFVAVLVIVIGTVYSIIVALIALFARSNKGMIYQVFRQNLGRSILLGLEFLVAGDIIRSVTGTPSFASVGVLLVVVFIRTFLSITFEMEIDGHWPWQRSRLSK